MQCVYPKEQECAADEDTLSLTEYYNPFWEGIQWYVTPMKALQTLNGGTNSQQKLLSLPYANLHDGCLNKRK